MATSWHNGVLGAGGRPGQHEGTVDGQGVLRSWRERQAPGRLVLHGEDQAMRADRGGAGQARSARVSWIGAGQLGSTGRSGRRGVAHGDADRPWRLI